MKYYLLLLPAFFIARLNGQTTADFESFGLKVDAFINNAGDEGAFADGNIRLPNEYDEVFMSWSGWAISTVSDTLTPGFTNQYSAIPGEGVNGSQHYAVSTVGFDFSGSVAIPAGEAAGGVVEGMYVTNSTYAYLSMRDGDSFAKKFGGETGDDPDYFLLSIRKFLNGQLSEDSIAFYLADYRFEDNSQDYIVDEWTWLDLSELGNADSLLFKLYSSDVGAFGMNTPAFFCVDDLITRDESTGLIALYRPGNINVHPNPVGEILHIRGDMDLIGAFQIVDLQGRVVSKGFMAEHFNQISLKGITRGHYFLIFHHQEGMTCFSIQKK